LFGVSCETLYAHISHMCYMSHPSHHPCLVILIAYDRSKDYEASCFM
jgi:hypothetical protein